MILSSFRDAVLLFLLIYALVDLTHTFALLIVKRLARKEPVTPEQYVMPLALLSPNNAEAQIRMAVRSCAPLFLIADGAEAETLSIARILAKDYDSVILLSAQDFHNHFTLSKDRAVFSVNSKAANLSHSKQPPHRHQPSAYSSQAQENSGQ